MAGGSWSIEYYETPAGRVPVLEWLEEMSAEDRALALNKIEQLALLGTEVRRPLVRRLSGKLYEIRWKSRETQHRIAYFATTGRKFVLLHGFTKKQRATPKRDLDPAKKRMADYERRHG